MKNTKKSSLKTQIIILIIIHITLIPLLVTLYYNYISKELISQKRDENISMTIALQNSIQSQYNDITNIMLYAGYSDSCITFLTNDITYQSYKSIYSVLDMLTSINKNIFNISITPIDKATCSIPGYQSPLMPSCLDYSDGQIHYDGYTEIRTTSTSSISVFSYSMNIISYGNVKSSGEKIGHMTLLVKADSIVKEISDINTLSNTFFYMVDSYGKTISLNEHFESESDGTIIDGIKSALPDYVYHESPEDSSAVPYYITETSLDNVHYMIQVNTLDSDLGYTIAITPYSTLLENAVMLRNMCYSMGVILTVLTIIAYLFIIKNFISPLNDLTKYIVSISHGNLKLMKKRVSLKGYREIESISNEFNLMMDEINQIRDQLFITTSRLYEQEVADKESKNLTLINQINPHFLFNTLDVIKGSVLMTGNKELYNVCFALGFIMKYSLNDTQDASLKDEISVISNFMKIIDYRFGERINLDVEYPDELSDFSLPRLSLYQYIYNTVTARLEPLAETGYIFLNLENSKESITISVTDNGVAISAEASTVSLIEHIETRFHGFYPKAVTVSCYTDDRQTNHLEISLKK
ncbi:MAG: histidine kinase [Lachnospiraceae bacterium]|nr:histidine kinase [Lachnospiraceae bacterium]MDY4096808.1 histidine kinase [Lachnospiraceae bacterium]